MNGFLSAVGARVLAACEETGQMLLLCAQDLRECRWAVAKRHDLAVQMKRIGNDTLFIAVAIAIFIGMVTHSLGLLRGLPEVLYGELNLKRVLTRHNCARETQIDAAELVAYHSVEAPSALL